MKTCFKCNRDLPRAAFYRHPEMADGLLGKCKDCTRADVVANRKKKIAYYRAYDALRFRRDPRRRKAVDAWGRAWKKRNPGKHKAHTALNNAMRDGKVTKPKACEACGEVVRLHGHHEDYSKPLVVAWLCVSCHVAVHRKVK